MLKITRGLVRGEQRRCKRRGQVRCGVGAAAPDLRGSWEVTEGFRAEFGHWCAPFVAFTGFHQVVCQVLSIRLQR